MGNWQINMKDSGSVLEGWEDITQSIYLILATVKGSDPLRPDFGSDLYLYLDRPLAKYRPALVYSITEAITKWEKRVRLVKCELSNDEKGKLTIILQLQVSDKQQTVTLNM